MKPRRIAMNIEMDSDQNQKVLKDAIIKFFYDSGLADVIQVRFNVIKDKKVKKP